MANDNVHKGHRARMKDKFGKSDFKGWEPHQVLEYILHLCIPRVDTNETAHNLINQFGGFANVFKVSKEQLCKVEGVGKVTADFIYTLGHFVRYYNEVRFKMKRFVLDSESCEQYMINLFDGLEREHFFIICLNARNEVIFQEDIFEGSFDSIDIDLPRILRIAVKNDASYVVMAHNHPSGIAIASDADIVSTSTIMKALNMCNIKLLDHIIVADGKCVSVRNEMLERGLIYTKEN